MSGAAACVARSDAACWYSRVAHPVADLGSARKVGVALAVVLAAAPGSAHTATTPALPHCPAAAGAASSRARRST